MMEKVLTLILLVLTLIGFAQNKEAIKYFDLGVEAYNKKDFKAADSLFTLSAKLEPHKDTYFNLAAAKNMLGDHCGFCKELYNASIYGDSGAVDIYRKNCISTQKIIYDGMGVKENDTIVYYCIVTMESCLNKKAYQFFKKYEQKDSSSSFIILITDPTKFKEEDFLSPSFEIGKVPSENIIYLLDKMPSFPGGEEASQKFLEEHLKYPKKALNYKIKGLVYLTFIVEADGSLTDVKVLKGIGYGCDEEALRVVKLMPKWIPGEKNGIKTRVKYFMRIRFRLIEW